MRCKFTCALALLAWVLPAQPARADELVLKDGAKITGTIVGFENDSFRVETSYGFAMIRKDKVAEITISAPKKEPEPKGKSSTPPAQPAAAPQAAAAPALAPAVAKEPSPPASTPPEPNPATPERMAAGANAAASSTPAKSEPASAKAKPISAAAAAPPAEPPAPPPAPDPTVIRDEVRGTQYVNLTYGFQMYKPPSWNLIPAARKALPDAVAALGTSDQTTLLVIGREHAKDSLEAHAAATGKALSDVYENYRLISSRHVSIAGLPAVEQRSRGTAEGHDWSVLLTTFYKGNDAFTLLGMTTADSDLIQVQENVVAKTVNSLTFTSQ